MIEIIKENITIIAPVALVVILLIWKFGKGSIGGGEGNAAYIQKNDPNAQSTYEESRENGKKPLTLKERLELSWQFLYEITDIVLSKFSTADQETALDIGKTLLQNGGHYEHVIDYGIKHNLGRSQDKGAAKGV